MFIPNFFSTHSHTNMFTHSHKHPHIHTPSHTQTHTHTHTQTLQSHIKDIHAHIMSQSPFAEAYLICNHYNAAREMNGTIFYTKQIFVPTSCVRYRIYSNTIFFFGLLYLFLACIFPFSSIFP